MNRTTLVVSFLSAVCALPLAAQDWEGRQYPAGNGNVSLAVADLDTDGTSDVVTAASGDDVLSVLLADGAGGLLPSTFFAMGDEPSDLALADFDEDGHADAIATFTSGLALRLGDGAGGFGALSTAPAEDIPRGLVVADLDADGQLDVATTLGFTAKVRAWLGDGKGGLQAASLSPVGPMPGEIDAGDLDADGLPELATCNSQGASFSLLHATGGGNFAPAQNLPAIGQPKDVLFGDVDEDGLLDLVTSTHSRVSLHLGDGGGGFTTTVEIGDGAATLRLVDLDGDGWEDLLGHHSVNERVLVRRGEEGPGFGPLTLFYAGLHATDEAALDLDGNGWLDIVACRPTHVTVLRGSGFAQFGAPGVQKLSQEPVAMVVADIDFDNDIDALTVNYGAGVNVARNDGAGGFVVSVVTSPLGSDLALGRLDADNTLDLVTVSEETSMLRAFAGSGAGAFVLKNTYTTALAGRVAIADVTLDGKSDVLLAGAGLGMMQGTGSGALAAPQHFVSPPDTHVAIAAADVDLDGDTDVVGLRLSPSRLVVVPSDGFGGFAPASSVAVPVQPQALALGDVTGDGAPDAVTAHEAGQLALMVNDGAGHFTQADTLEPGPNPLDVALADTDLDGSLDVVAANADGANVSVLLGLAGGGFAEPRLFAAGDTPCAVAVADFDGDERPDLLLTDRSPSLFSCDLTLLRNEGPLPPWTNAGHGLAGGPGVPMLVGVGTLQPDTTTRLLLHGAKPVAAAFLVIGAPAINAPFKGGVLVPAPSLVLGVATDGFGEFTGVGDWPAGLPSGLTIWFQCWVADTAAVHDLSASNALGATSP